jgi:Superfamily II DNA/RNA helicases, SNF2 family
VCLIGKKESLIRQMNSPGCILVTSYVGTVQHQEALLARDWHYVILDEGHKIRNPDAQVGIRDMNVHLVILKAVLSVRTQDAGSKELNSNLLLFPSFLSSVYSLSFYNSFRFQHK